MATTLSSGAMFKHIDKHVHCEIQSGDLARYHYIIVTRQHMVIWETWRYISRLLTYLLTILD